MTFVVSKIYKRQPTTPAEAFSRLEKERKGTLGMIYKKAKSEGIISQALEPRFDSLLKERNWLIHNSRTESSSDLYNDDLREKAIRRIQAIQEEVDQVKKLLFSDFCVYMQSHGVDLHQGFQMGEEKIRRLKGL